MTKTFFFKNGEVLELAHVVGVGPLKIQNNTKHFFIHLENRDLRMNSDTEEYKEFFHTWIKSKGLQTK